MKNYGRVLMTGISATMILLTACSGGEGDKKDEKSKPRVVQVERTPYEVTVLAVGDNMSDMSFDPKEIKVSSNNTVKISLINKGTDASMVHNIVIIQYGTAKEVANEGLPFKENSYVRPDDGRVIAASKLAGPGETVVLEFDAPAPGTYQYVCTYPGHWMNMQGKFIVE